MNIAHIEENCFVYGPGCRFVIWTQGCSIHCDGCWNKEMWSFDTINEISMHKLTEQIENEIESIEGVTILGGEPFDQFDELKKLVKQIRKLDLSIIVYTGYSLNELLKKNYTKIYEFIDILISEKYDNSKRSDNGGLIGSSNQKITFLSNKYSKEELPLNNQIEISINSNGQINYYGFPY